MNDLIAHHLENNRRLLAELWDRGDNEQLTRPVDHFVYFTSLTEAETYADWARSCGYGVDEIGEHESTFCVPMVIHHDTLPQTVARICAQLDAKAQELGGEYDGWGSPVMADNEAPPPKKSLLQRLLGK